MQEPLVSDEVTINAHLAADLQRQATACELTPARFAAELLECAIAERKLRHSIKREEVSAPISNIYTVGA